MALIPLAIGINFQTGQKLIPINNLGDAESAFLGLVFELLAIVLVIVSRSSFLRILFAVLYMMQAALVSLWGGVVMMLTGWGDGSSKGADTDDILPWFLSGLTYASFAIYTFVSIAKADRKAKLDAESGNPGHPPFPPTHG